MSDPAHLELVEEYFDTHAVDWSELYAAPRSPGDWVLADRMRFALDWLSANVPAGGRILDAGCGAGVLSLELAGRGYRVEGIDVSEKMIAIASANRDRRGVAAEQCSFRKADLAELSGRTFDGIAAMGFIQYQPDEVAMLSRLRDLLEPEGVLVVSGPGRHRLTDVFGLYSWYRNRRMPGGEERRKLMAISVHEYDRSRFRDLLGQAGLSLSDHRGHGFTNCAVLNRSAKVDIAIHRTLSALARVLPLGRFGNDHVVLARRGA